MEVLVVEDDLALGMVWEDALSAEGFNVTTADSLERASVLMKARLFNVIILDMMLKGASALPLSDFALYAAPSTRIILATGSKLFSAGEFLSNWPNIHHCVRKPVRIDDLVALVAHAGQQTAEMQVYRQAAL